MIRSLALLPALLPALLLVLASAVLGTGARAESLVTSLSSHQVAITSNYTGSQVVLFGAVRRDAQTISRTGPYQAAVIVRGPMQTVTVRLREERGFLWINGEQQKFANVPAFYAALTSAPLDEIAAPALRDRLAVGLDGLGRDIGDTVARGGREATFREALVRLKRRLGLYVESDRGVTFMTPEIFRSAIVLPADSPPGNYEVEVMLFADGSLLAVDRTNFELVKIGFEQRITALAENQSLVYGLGTAGTAIFLGWLASVVFRRD
ncbi:TIGR02186 family protein [Salinarimonas ramus]|uniref:Membrane protein n=1 Tax=Salinarimonas ramus TaxID=690164 RepID=A0A917QAG7_9HYPH|nr:TIGR02186 family protein [Salinarimonas ramus]GGK38804.1 membrane protein [Salinarimonas ramus]